MTKLQLVKEGMFSTQYAIYDGSYYIGECFAYAVDLKDKFEINVTWCFFSGLQDALVSFVDNNEYKIVNELREALNTGYPEYILWDFNTRIILNGKVLNVKDFETNY